MWLYTKSQYLTRYIATGIAALTICPHKVTYTNTSYGINNSEGNPVKNAYRASAHALIYTTIVYNLIL